MEIEPPQSIDELIKSKLFENRKKAPVLGPSDLAKQRRNLSTSYENESDQFIVSQFKSIQYASLYYSRLQMLRPHIEKQLRDVGKTSNDIIDVKPNMECIVIGTIYKEMKLKPNFFNKNVNINTILGNGKVASLQAGVYCSDTDLVHLEDHTGRMKVKFTQFEKPSIFESVPSFLSKSISEKDLLTGIVIGLEGYTDDAGLFYVQKAYFPELPPQTHSIGPSSQLATMKTGRTMNTASEGTYVAIVSGLEMHEDDDQLPRHLLKQFLLGNPSLGFLSTLSQRVIRLIQAGNLVKEHKELKLNLLGSYKMAEHFQKMAGDVSKTLDHIEQYFKTLSILLPIDIMPGPNDPCDAFMPQQPMEKAYFAKSFSSNDNIQTVTNPYAAEINECHFLGTSGQNIEDLAKYSNFTDNVLDLMEATIVWRHLVPTAPDTFKCQPFSDDDPFVLRQLPNVYFVGNMPQFETKLIQMGSSKCRIISVPKFSESKSLVLVNINNLDAFEVRFDI